MLVQNAANVDRNAVVRVNLQQPTSSIGSVCRGRADVKVARHLDTARVTLVIATRVNQHCVADLQGAQRCPGESVRDNVVLAGAMSDRAFELAYVDSPAHDA